jgi:predicted transport protein
MPIYKISNRKVSQLGLKREGFGHEAELRDFFADNLEEILGVRFLEKEYPTTDGRMDTIGIDENDSPVIIEYKWKENEEVLSQGLYYFDWLLHNKRHFNLLVKSKLGEEIEVNWDQPRVILIAQGFSRYVKTAVQQVKNVELKTYNLYDGDVLHIENEYTPYPEKVRSARVIIEEDQQGVQEYNLEYHLSMTSPEMQKVFQDIRARLLELPSVEERDVQKSGITYRTTKSFVVFNFRRESIQVCVKESTYPEDTKGIMRDITEHKWGYSGMLKLTKESDLDYIFSIIKASYNSTL